MGSQSFFEGTTDLQREPMARVVSCFVNKKAHSTRVTPYFKEQINANTKLTCDFEVRVSRRELKESVGSVFTKVILENIKYYSK